MAALQAMPINELIPKFCRLNLIKSTTEAGKQSNQSGWAEKATSGGTRRQEESSMTSGSLSSSSYSSDDDIFIDILEKEKRRHF